MVCAERAAIEGLVLFRSKAVAQRRMWRSGGLTLEERVDSLGFTTVGQSVVVHGNGWGQQRR